MARNLTMDEWGILEPGHYLIHDRDTKFAKSVDRDLRNAMMRVSNVYRYRRGHHG